MSMKLTGITDEAGASVQTQINVTKELGWDSIELRVADVEGHEAGLVHEISEEAFDEVERLIKDSGLAISGFGSGIGNWAHSIDGDFQITLDEIERCIPRMHRLDSQIVRIMSYAILQDEEGKDAEDQRSAERFRRVREIHKRFEDSGITAVHENCMNYGGMGYSYTEELLSEVPGLKLVFDTGNPVFNRDRTVGGDPMPMQNAWIFYDAIKEHIVHVHIKDGVWNEESQKCDFCLAGRGDGDVEKILVDLKSNGYDGYISIEPHTAVVFHDEEGADDLSAEEKAKVQWDAYVEYGRDLESWMTKLDLL